MRTDSWKQRVSEIKIGERLPELRGERSDKVAVAGWGQKAGYENIPGFRSVAVGGLGLFGLMAQGGLRQSFQAIEQGL